MRLERELDARHRYVVWAGLPAECQAIRRLNSLDHASMGATWSSRAIPRKDDLSAWTQVDGRLRAEPGAEHVRLRQRSPDARRGHRQDDFAFDRVRDLHDDLPTSACNYRVAHTR